MEEHKELGSEVANDPRFNTAYKRVNWFRRPNESDEQFAKRLGISVEDLENCKTEEGVLEMCYSVFQSIGEALDVLSLWLMFGVSHSVTVFPDGKHRLTMFLRCRPYHDFVDDPMDDEPRSHFECRLKERGLSVIK
jgi:hypothetical protein